MRTRLLSSVAMLGLMLAMSSPSPAQGRHPQIERALGALSEAREHLNRAAHDFGGHRVDAIRAIDEAERQLRLCLQY